MGASQVLIEHIFEVLKGFKHHKNHREAFDKADNLLNHLVDGPSPRIQTPHVQIQFPLDDISSPAWYLSQTRCH